MNAEIKKILDLIESNGYEAFIVGGYVRDHLLGIASTDIDICTNALPKDLMNIFSYKNPTISKYGIYKIVTDNYNFDITTYRQELNYTNRRPDEIIYINNLLADIKRRDFTINTICMNSKGEIIDLLDGLNDLKHHLIKAVGDPDIKLKEDPLRILRAYRLSIILNFKIEKNLLKSLNKNLKLIQTLSLNRQRWEIDRILASKYAISGLKILNKAKVLNLLGISYHHIIYVDDLIGMYAQLTLPDNYPLTKQEKENIIKIKEIINSKQINNLTIYKYGLYIALVSGKIMHKDVTKITAMANSMPIKVRKDLAINSKEIMTILNIKPSSIIKIIEDDLINKVLTNKLKNDKDNLICYVINNRKEWLHE
jgi:tRNA nucleotidyltransferase (CCA-adding enzyme)